MTTQHPNSLPHWDLRTLYPDLNASEFEADFTNAITNIKTLGQLFDQHAIDRTDTPPTGTELVTIFETIINQFNQIMDSILTLQVYIYTFTVVDSRNNVAQAKMSELQQQLAQLTVLTTRLIAWLGCLDIPYLVATSPVAQAHAYMLHKTQIEAQHLMTSDQEVLAADLVLTGSQSWYQMFSNYTSQLMVTIESDGKTEKIPATAANKRFFNPKREVRRQAYEAVQITMKEATVPMAAALNSIKGETLTLTKRRGWESPLAVALHNNAIDQDMLTAMLTATREAYPTLRRYLKARARYLNIPHLAWYDRVVPLSQGGKTWSFAETAQFITEQFGTYSPRMRQLAERAFAENWIDAEPRDGKRGGAFCLWIQPGESRILLNFEPVFTSVSTLAHELGHAYHNLNLANCTFLQRDLPMTLAETASTFCQKIVDSAALKTAAAQDQLVILDTSLEYAVRAIMNADSDFLFEEMLFKKRQQRALSADELCELSHKSQQQTFGDGLDPAQLNPYRWVNTPHYYVTSYYNFPYTFGLLFGLGLYAQYQNDPQPFLAGYDALLASTGRNSAADLAARFGLDIRTPAFWADSLKVLEADIERFETLTLQTIK